MKIASTLVIIAALALSACDSGTSEETNNSVVVPVGEELEASTTVSNTTVSNSESGSTASDTPAAGSDTSTKTEKTTTTLTTNSN